LAGQIARNTNNAFYLCKNNERERDGEEGRQIITATVSSLSRSSSNSNRHNKKAGVNADDDDDWA
jgi:hypothetical protein